MCVCVCVCNLQTNNLFPMRNAPQYRHMPNLVGLNCRPRKTGCILNSIQVQSQACN